MSKKALVTLGIIVALVLLLAWVLIRPGPLAFAGDNTVPLAQYDGRPTGVPADFTGTELVDRGRYLTDAADCQACHTPHGGEPFAGGRAFHTPFGVIYSTNITPDVETGIGSWSDAEFVRAMHHGIAKGGVRLYPAFPFASYTYLTEEDVLAIKAYLFSLPPKQKASTENELMFPFNQRWLMAIWSALYNPGERFEPVADRSPTWNRGAYMAEALGHCGDCHTPRTMLQALDNRRKFAGGVAEGWRAYNLTSDNDSGIGTWSNEDLENYLKTGHSFDRGSAMGPMAEAVHLSFARMTASDLKAIVEYVKSIPPVSSPDLPAPKLTPAPHDPLHDVEGGSDLEAGAMIFSGLCAGCHGWTGVNPHVPHSTLTGTRAVNDPTATNVALAILRGAGTLPPSGDIAIMPAFGGVLSDREVASVSNYVTSRLGAEGSSLTAEDVARLREAQ